MEKGNVTVKRNAQGTYNVQIKEGNRVYEIPDVNVVRAPGLQSDWLVSITEYSSKQETVAAIPCP